LAPKKVLIITYYWPPGGGAGVQRWLKFVKYLNQFGWQPVVYTPENGEMPVLDDSLAADIPQGTAVIKTPIWEPYDFYKKLVGAQKGEKINTGFLTEKKRPGFKEKLAVWLRGNIFIPDARRFWIKPSVRFLDKWLTQNPVDAIVSTGPPHSMHLIANAIARSHKIPWLADFRDPWTNIDYYQDLMLTTWADKKHHELERRVVTEADRVVVVGQTMKEEFESRFNRKTDVITNGFDEDDIVTTSVVSSGKFVIAHVGTLVRSRNPEILWRAVAELVNENNEFSHDLSIRLTGKIDLSVRNSITASALDRFVTYVDYLPHDQVAQEQQSASVLLLILNDTPNSKGILTGKLFEYLASGRPVLCIGPEDGDAAAVIRETRSGMTCNFQDQDKVKTALLEFFSDHKKGNKKSERTGIEKYSRKELTRKLAQILNEMTAVSR
jgi:glycosyltransferase involved in cell wall biosynthesis